MTTTSAFAQQPTYNSTFLTDEQLEDYDSMTAEQIQDFLVSQGSYFGQSIQDVDSVTFNPSQVIAEAASLYKINPQVLLATLQKESSGVTRTTRPSDTTLRFLMGCVSQSTAREQLTCAAERFRAYHDQLTNTGSTVSGWRVGVPKETQDGVIVTPATKAVAGQFTYTPYAGVQWGGQRVCGPNFDQPCGGVFLFYDAWTRFGFGASAQPTPNNATVTDIPNPDTYSCSQPGYVDFEELHEGTNLSSGTIAGVRFTTTNGYTWLVGDFATGFYNGKYPNGGYTSHGTHWAWLGVAQGSGLIDFPKGPASYFSLLTSAFSPVSLDAYDANGNLLDTAGPSPNNYNTGHMTELKITRATADMAYVIVHDQGNFFLIDDVCTNAPGTPNTINRIVDQTYFMQTGQHVSGSFFIDFVASFRKYLRIFIGPFFSDVELVLTRPDGTIISPSDPGVTFIKTANSIEVTIEDAPAGEWNYEIIAIELDPGGEDIRFVVDEQLIVASDTPTTADLSVTKIADQESLIVGQDLIYNLTVVNHGPGDAIDVIVADTLPAGVTFVSATPSQGNCTEASGVITCNLGDLANGASATMTIVVTPMTVGAIANTATVTSNTPDPNIDNNSSNAQTTVIPVPVTIDIQPEGSPNSINCNNRNGVIPVAILTTDAFDTRTVDYTTLAFEGARESHVDKKTDQPIRHEEDVDGDGDIDLVFHFRLSDMALTCDSTQGTLTGSTFAGLPIQGTDSVRMVPGTARSLEVDLSTTTVFLPMVAR